MKKLIMLLSASALLLVAPLRAIDSFESNPGYIDFSKYITLSGEDATVEVNIKGPLLRLAASILEGQDEQLSQLIERIQLVRVHVYEVNDGTRDQFAASVQSIAQTLKGKNWEQLVTVKDGNENVAVFANMPNGDTIAGIVVSVSDGGEAVFVNIVGDVAFESLAEIGKKLNITALDKIGDMLEDG